MFYLIQSLILILIEVCCCVIFFETFANKRRRSKLFCFAIAAALATGLYFGAYIFRGNFTLKIVTVFVTICAAMYAYFDASIWRSILLTIIYQALLLVVDYVTYLLYYISANQSYAKYSAVILLGKAVVLMTVLAIRKIFKKHSLPETDRPWYISFPLCTIVLIAIMVPMTANVTADQANLFSAVALALIGINIFDFYYINELQRRTEEKSEMKILESKAKDQLEMYQSKKREMHEYKNHIACLNLLASEGKYENLQEYLKTMGNYVGDMESHIYTNHPIIDAVLSAKYIDAEKLGINMVASFADLSGVSVEDKYIVIILSNILDNAIEACQTCNGKQIKVKIDLIGDLLGIMVSNPHKNKIVCKQGEYLTTKNQNPEDHGMGIKNIIASVKQCGGHYEIIPTEDKFAFYVSIPVHL